MVSVVEQEKILGFVRAQPRSMQEIASCLGRSWVTADTYVKQVKEDTGLLDVKVFRQGSHGALKVVYYLHQDMKADDALKQELAELVKRSQEKKDFDFLEVFQYIETDKKKAEVVAIDSDGATGPGVFPLLVQARDYVYWFSGNLSFVDLCYDGVALLDVLEGLLKRKVKVKIICRINFATLANLKKLERLLATYGDFIEVKHRYQPLRGLIIDGEVAHMKSEEEMTRVKSGELLHDVRVFYQVFDRTWVHWLQHLFFDLYRNSIDASRRVKELEELTH